MDWQHLVDDLRNYLSASGINPHDWLTSTLTKLANGYPAKDFGSLMPWTPVA